MEISQNHLKWLRENPEYVNNVRKRRKELGLDGEEEADVRDGVQPTKLVVINHSSPRLSKVINDHNMGLRELQKDMNAAMISMLDKILDEEEE